MDVASWLRSLGLEKYEALFRENEIDADVLPELTQLDLEKLGVPLGHRKRLLKAIATLGAEQKVGVEFRSFRPDIAERRQVTVMFSDLVGSTALSARMDPEDLFTNRQSRGRSRNDHFWIDRTAFNRVDHVYPRVFVILGKSLWRPRPVR